MPSKNQGCHVGSNLHKLRGFRAASTRLTAPLWTAKPCCTSPVRLGATCRHHKGSGCNGNRTNHARHMQQNVTVQQHCKRIASGIHISLAYRSKLAGPDVGVMPNHKRPSRPFRYRFYTPHFCMFNAESGLKAGLRLQTTSAAQA